MTEKSILKFIQRKKHTSLDIIYRKFECVSQKHKSRIKSILKTLKEQGQIKMDEKNHKIMISGMDTKRPRSVKKSSDDTRIFRYTENSQDDLPIIKDKYQLPGDFVPAIMNELEQQIWNDQPSLEHHRKDLRDLFMITIDGADSKDLDDAVTISKSFFGGWQLGVHIADVSYYVPQNTSLDVEAKERANSYYFINKVTPMLPKQLSNDLCSLNPNEEKKAMSIFINLDNRGNIKSYEIMPSLIKTSYRMTYDRVEQIIKGDSEKDPTLKKTVGLMDKLFRILHEKRMKKGSVDFNFREKKVILDDNDSPTKIYQKDRLDSERLIEEFMLLANQVAGEYLSKNGMGLYRVHDLPPSEKYQRLRNFASKRGYQLAPVPDSKDLQEFVNSLIGLPVQMCGEILALRSMAQAVYQQDNIGHFGLGFELYAHFTSPIRRYADLVVHRLIKYYLFKSEYKEPPYTSEQLDNIARHISSQERVALEAERDLYKIKATRYMKDREGDTINGKISSVANFSIFLEDEESGVEAMIRYVDMPEYITFNEDELTAYNRNKTKVYSIGMKVQFRIAKVNVERAFIDATDLKIIEK